MWPNFDDKKVILNEPKYICILECVTQGTS